MARIYWLLLLLSPVALTQAPAVSDYAQAYRQPVPELSYEQRKRFKRGDRGFSARWVVFPFLGGEWGLGPTFIAERCSDCHVNAGRGAPPAAPGRPLRQMLVRLSVPGAGEHGAPKPHPVYGSQLQNRGLTGEDPRAHGYGERVLPEGEVSLIWQITPVSLAGGEEIALRRPGIRFDMLNFGPLGAEVMTSLRNTPPVFGLGLLAAVPDTTLLALAEQQRRRGYNGRPNRVWDAVNRRQAIGRFGWKANIATLREQIAAAFIGDIGVTSTLFPDENCPPAQTDCAAQPPGNQPELIDGDLDDLELWTASLMPPARRNADDPDVIRGEALFRQAECDVCHVPRLTTGPYPELSALENREIYPYTDLLLHDMGEGLADGRPDFQAGPRDWRTPPLWGLGLSAQVSGQPPALLHDGRAATVGEAILWHGGEAARARDAFAAMPKAERQSLVAFVLSL